MDSDCRIRPTENFSWVLLPSRVMVATSVAGVGGARGSPFGRRRGERHRTDVHPWPRRGLGLSIWEPEIVTLSWEPEIVTLSWGPGIVAWGEERVTLITNSPWSAAADTRGRTMRKYIRIYLVSQGYLCNFHRKCNSVETKFDLVKEQMIWTGGPHITISQPRPQNQPRTGGLGGPYLHKTYQLDAPHLAALSPDVGHSRKARTAYSTSPPSSNRNPISLFHEALGRPEPHHRTQGSTPVWHSVLPRFPHPPLTPLITLNQEQSKARHTAGLSAFHDFGIRSAQVSPDLNHLDGRFCTKSRGEGYNTP